MEITRSRDKCFDDIANYLTTMISLTLTVEVYGPERAKRYAPTDSAVLDAKQVGKRLRIYPHTVLDEVFAGRWPTRLIMDEEPVQIDASATLTLDVFDRPLYALQQSMFINYYEREGPQVEAKYGEMAGWPADWHFAWSVRNAVAHNNQVYFRKQKRAAAPVTWRGLTYAPADNGQTVLNVDLWPGDLIYLLLDLDKHLR